MTLKKGICDCKRDQFNHHCMLRFGALTGNQGNGGNMRSGNGGDSADHYVTRYEAQKDARIAELETEVKLRDANTYTPSEATSCATTQRIGLRR